MRLPVIPAAALGSVQMTTVWISDGLPSAPHTHNNTPAPATSKSLIGLAASTSAIGDEREKRPWRGTFLGEGLRVGEDRSEEITELLKAWSAGETAALDRLTEVVYQELRRMARRYMSHQKPGNSLQATALVNEVYLRLVDVKNIDWQQRSQFFALSAVLMRRILVDRAREYGSLKRGGDAVRIDVDDVAIVSAEPSRFILSLDAALEELAKLAPRQAKVVELRYFGGMSEEEAAEALQTSPRTVRRDWQFARAWLARELGSGA